MYQAELTAAEATVPEESPGPDDPAAQAQLEIAELCSEVLDCCAVQATPSSGCFLCGADHMLRECPILLALTHKSSFQRRCILKAIQNLGAAPPGASSSPPTPPPPSSGTAPDFR